MCVVKRAVMLLLMLLAPSFEAAMQVQEDCEDLKKVEASDLHKVFGHWVLDWTVADYKEGLDLLPNLTSNWFHFHLLSDNQTFVFDERNMISGNHCSRFVINMTTAGSDNHTLHNIAGTMENDGVISPYNNFGHLDFYESCSDCLIGLYEESQGRFLLNYKREGHHLHRDAEQLGADHSRYEKMAACLGFHADHVEHAFVYDGAADFCPEVPHAENEAATSSPPEPTAAS